MWYVILGVIIGAVISIESITSRMITYFINIGYSEEGAVIKIRNILRSDYKYYKRKV